MLIMPDCHGRLFCFAVEKSVTPRGDQIPVIEFQTTAPPSRVNFREIRAPGVYASKMQKSPENRMYCGNIAACSRLSGLFPVFFDFFVQEDIQNSKGNEERKITGFLYFRGSSNHRTLWLMDEERFFAKTELSFVQNSADLSKECEEKKFFGISGFRGFEKAGFFAYRRREIQNVPKERRMRMPCARMMPFPSAAFHHEKGAIHHNSGCR